MSVTAYTSRFNMIHVAENSTSNKTLCGRDVEAKTGIEVWEDASPWDRCKTCKKIHAGT